MTQEVGGFVFCMRKKYMDQVRSVCIDYDGTEFQIFTERMLSAFCR